jgi:hypothetical protein
VLEITGHPLEQAVFFGVHPGRIRFIVVVVTQAMESAVDDVQEQLVLDRVTPCRGLPVRLIQTDQDVGVQNSGGAVGKVEGQNVGGAGDARKAFMGVRHRRIVDDPNPDLAGGPKQGDRPGRVLREPGVNTGLQSIHGDSPRGERIVEGRRSGGGRHEANPR